MKTSIWLYALALSYLPGSGVHAANEGDPHYNAAGFFDVHVCNWPDKPRFLMALFSTTRFDEVARVTVFAPDGKLVGDLDLARFRAFKAPSGQPKRAFIAHFDLPAKTVDGWYRATISLKDGSRFAAKDYVVHYVMPGVGATQPEDDARDVPVQTELRWDSIPGARYYQVTIRDIWTPGTEATVSDLITDTRYVPPQGLLRSGGEYTWRIHARDSNGNVLLGDFNHGSVSRELRFAVK